MSLNWQKQYDRALVAGLHALDVAEHEIHRDDGKVAASLHDLGLIYQHLGQYTQAEPAYQRALAIMEKKLGPENFMTVKCRKDFASLYRAMGREGDATELEQR